MFLCFVSCVSVSYMRFYIFNKIKCVFAKEKIERKKIQIAHEIKDYEILNGNDDYEDDEEFSDLEERDK